MPLTHQPLNVSIGGNTSGALADISSGTLLLAGGNNITLSQNANSVTISAAAAAPSPVNVSAGTTSNNLQTVVFSDSNRVSFGLNGSTITAKHALNFSAGTTSNNISDQIVFSNANGLTFGLDGSTITGSYTVPTVPAQFSGGNSNLGNTQGDTGVVTGRLVLVGTNNITLSGSTNGGSMTISISGGAGGAGNTGSISAGTTRGTLGEIVFSDSNRVSFGIDGQTVTAKHALNFSAGTTSQNISDQVVFSNSNGVSFGLNGSTITATAGAIHSIWAPCPAIDSNVANTLGNTNMAIWPYQADQNLTASRFHHALSVTYSTAASTHTLRVSVAIYLGIYTRTGSTLSSATTASTGFSFTVSSNDSTGSISGRRIVSFAMDASLTPGIYWFGLLSSTSSSRQAGGTNSLNFSNVMGVPNLGVDVGSGAAGRQGMMAAAYANSAGLNLPFQGYFSHTGTGFKSAIQMSEITQGTLNAAMTKKPTVYAINFTS